MAWNTVLAIGTRDQRRLDGYFLQLAVLKEVLMFKPDEEARGRGRPRLRFYETVKTDLLERDVSISARHQPGF